MKTKINFSLSLLFFFLRIATAGQPESRGALGAEITTGQQRFESVKVPGLHRWVLVISEISLASSNPATPARHAQNHYGPAQGSIWIGTAGDDLILLGRKPCKISERLLPGHLRLGLGSPVFCQLAPLGEVVGNEPANDRHNDGKNGDTQGQIGWPEWIWWWGWHWYHWVGFFLMCFLSGVSLYVMGDLILNRPPKKSKWGHIATPEDLARAVKYSQEQSK